MIKRMSKNIALAAVAAGGLLSPAHRPALAQTHFGGIGLNPIAAVPAARIQLPTVLPSLSGGALAGLGATPSFDGRLSSPRAVPAVAATPRASAAAGAAAMPASEVSWSDALKNLWPAVGELVDSQGEREARADEMAHAVGLPSGLVMRRVNKWLLTPDAAQEYRVVAYGTQDPEGRFSKGGYIVYRFLGYARQDDGRRKEAEGYAFVLSTEGAVTKVLALDHGEIHEQPLAGLEGRLVETLAYLLSDAPGVQLRPGR